MKWRNAVVGVTVMLAATGCSTTHHLAVTQPVGPDKLKVARTGTLEVYTATEEYADGDNSYSYPHTDYLVYNGRGQKVECVHNHLGIMDETPALTELPPGSYMVVAEAEGYGRVRVPVVIEPNRKTVVHLERGWKAPENTQASDLVHMLDGQAIGWRSETVNHNLISGPSQLN